MAFSKGCSVGWYAIRVMMGKQHIIACYEAKRPDACWWEQKTADLMAQVLSRTAVLFCFLSQHKATLKFLVQWTGLDIAWGDFSDVRIQSQYYFSSLDLLIVLTSSRGSWASPETSFLTKNKLLKVCNNDVYAVDQKDVFLLHQKRTWH